MSGFDPDDSRSLLDRLVVAALEAGEATLSVYDGEMNVATKADRSPVTAADLASEAVILEHLRDEAPRVPVVAEEQVASGLAPEIGAAFFLVDPLDGTKEFIRRNGDFTVNIALISEARPVLGVVYAPVRQVLYIGDAIRSEAFKVDPCTGDHSAVDLTRGLQPIHVRAAPEDGITAVASRSHHSPEVDLYLSTLRVAKRMEVGSSLKFCMVASGDADLYPRFGPTMEWDTAAGHAVLLAAGGSVRTPDGRPLLYGKDGFRNPSFIARGV